MRGPYNISNNLIEKSDNERCGGASRARSLSFLFFLCVCIYLVHIHLWQNLLRCVRGVRLRYLFLFLSVLWRPAKPCSETRDINLVVLPWWRCGGAQRIRYVLPAPAAQQLTRSARDSTKRTCTWRRRCSRGIVEPRKTWAHAVSLFARAREIICAPSSRRTHSLITHTVYGVYIFFIRIRFRSNIMSMCAMLSRVHRKRVAHTRIIPIYL